MMNEDDADPDRHDEQMNARFSHRAKSGYGHISRISARLAQRHGIADATAHDALLRTVFSLRQEIPSIPDLKVESWAIPRDLTTWQNARKSLGEVVDGCQKISKVLNARDPTVFTALQIALDTLPYRKLSDLHRAIIELQDVAREAASIRGHSGNRPFPEWMQEATRICIQFWQNDSREKAVGYFRTSKKPSRGKISQATSPANDFSRWFCDLMGALTSASPSTCETLLRNASKASAPAQHRDVVSRPGPASGKALGPPPGRRHQPK